MKRMLFFLILILGSAFVYGNGAGKQGPRLDRIGAFKCGKQPKQVLFSPDGKYIVLPLLDDNGFDVFDVEKRKILKRINPPHAEKKGFAEGLFVTEKNAFFVSQMTTGTIYEYSLPDFNFVRSIPTEGTWSKFIAWSKEKNLLAVSNWTSNDLSLIDYDEGKVKLKIKTSGAPRGMVFTDKGEEIISLSFDDGVIEKFSVESGKKLDSIKVQNSAMRHIAVSSDGKTAFISDMFHRKVYKMDVEEFKITGKVTVFNNPNTIELLDDSCLFVSCRGPNNKTAYTGRSPVNGKICIVDTESMTVVKEIEGGNQPTGLDISLDGNLLCFSNFQDEELELYYINFNVWSLILGKPEWRLLKSQFNEIAGSIFTGKL